MRVYFLSDLPCALFVNGMHLGQVDGFARRIELSPVDGAFCECKRADCLPVRFRFDEDFLFSPPEGVRLFFYRGAVAVRLAEFVRADPSLRVVWQKHFAGRLLTLCVQGRVVLNFEREKKFVQIALPLAFDRCRASAAGENVLLETDGAFAIVGREGELLALSDGTVRERGNTVVADVPLGDALRHVMRCRYEQGKLTACEVVAARAPDETSAALALFESVLAGIDPACCLAPALQPKAGLLRAFLGDFSAVIPLGEGEVGLAVRRRERVFDVRGYKVTLEGGKVSNILPLDD